MNTHLDVANGSGTELGTRGMQRQSMKVTRSFCLKSKWEAVQSYTKEISYQQTWWAQTGVHTEPPAPLSKSHQWELCLITSLRLWTPVRKNMLRLWEPGITPIKPRSGRFGCQIDFNCKKKKEKKKDPYPAAPEQYQYIHNCALKCENILFLTPLFQNTPFRGIYCSPLVNGRLLHCIGSELISQVNSGHHQQGRFSLLQITASFSL